MMRLVLVVVEVMVIEDVVLFDEVKVFNKVGDGVFGIGRYVFFGY